MLFTPLQALPLLVLLPLRRVCSWMLLLSLWYYFGHLLLVRIGPGGQRQLWALIIAVLVTRILVQLVMPWVGIAAKWLIVGRYRAGRYKLWGSKYLRWWMVDKVGSIGC